MSLSNENEKVVWGKNTSGRPAYMGRRTAAHVNYTIARLAVEHPSCRLEVIQAGWSLAPASAGTHSLDRCVDFRIVGLSWSASQRFLRECGWAAWYRHPPEFDFEHLHAVTLGSTAPCGIYVPGQVDDYLEHRTGLVGHAHDPSWFPPNIAATEFDYKSWLKEQDMEYKDWSQESKDALVKDIWNLKPPAAGVTMRALVIGLAQKAGVLK